VIYLDNASTTRLHPAVAKAMAEAPFGNPSSLHAAGRAARKAVEDARERVAALLGADPKEIVFTSGATEADNLAVMRPGRIVTSAVEHPAVLEAAPGAVRVPVDEDGLIDAGAFERALDGAALASVMAGNNEVGTLQPVRELAAICRRKGVLFHTDAAQAGGKVDLRGLGADLVTLSAHKMNGPKGVGALYVRRGVALAARQVGGGQEFERRAGTENVAAIVGFGAACALPRPDVNPLRERLREAIERRVPDIRLNGHPTRRLPHILNVTFRCVDGEAVVIALDAAGVCASSGSACASQSLEPSPVLLAMGRSKQDARGSVRFSVGIDTTPEEADRAAEIAAGVVARLRSISPVAP
jgi:cysteine desulfurase